MKSLTKLRDVLLVIAAHPGVGLADIARKVAMPKSTVYRLLRALERTEFLLQDTSLRAYRLGPLVPRLLSGPNVVERLSAIARPLMVQLRDKCNETIALHVLEGQSWITIDQVESTQELRRTITTLKLPMPLHAAAPGKVFLAYLSEEQQQEYLARQELRAFTPATITNRRRLSEELSKVRKQGYAMSFQEMAIGVAGISMPLRGSDGSVRAVLGVSGPLSRFTPKAVAAIRTALRATCQEIEGRLPSVAGATTTLRDGSSVVRNGSATARPAHRRDRQAGR